MSVSLIEECAYVLTGQQKFNGQFFDMEDNLETFQMTTWTENFAKRRSISPKSLQLAEERGLLIKSSWEELRCSREI